MSRNFVHVLKIEIENNIFFLLKPISLKNNGEIRDNYGFCCVVASTVPIESQRQYNDSDRYREDLQMVSGGTTDFKHAIASKATDDILDT